MFERLPELVNDNADLVRRGRFLTVTFLVTSGETQCLRGKVDAIDTRRCPLYLLTGEYDFSCTPDDTRRTAAAIKGARVTVMKSLGHFPMSEHPAQFRTYLLPVLDEIRAHAARA